MTESVPPGTIAGLANARELGGHRTTDGLIVRHGLVYRSAAPADPAQLSVLEGLRIAAVIDLRTDGELQQRPAIVSPPLLIHSDMLADEPDAGPVSLGRIAKAAMAGETDDLDPERLRQAFLRGYGNFVTMGSAQASARQILTHLADSESPTLIHCTAGKDRTGWIIALTLSAVGVPDETIMADYLESGPAVAALFAPYRQQFEEQGGDVAAMDVALAVFPEYLQRAFDVLREEFGSTERYLAEGLGLDAGFRERLAARLLVESAT